MTLCPELGVRLGPRDDVVERVPRRREAPAPRATTPSAPGATGAEARPAVLRRTYVSLVARRLRAAASSLERVAQPAEAAGDPARDRPLRQVELRRDRPVALVASEEAVEHLLAVLGQLGERLADGERLVEVRSAPARVRGRSAPPSAARRELADRTSMQSLRVSCAIQGRTAASSRRVSSRVYTRVKTSW